MENEAFLSLYNRAMKGDEDARAKLVEQTNDGLLELFGQSLSQNARTSMLALLLARGMDVRSLLSCSNAKEKRIQKLATAIWKCPFSSADRRIRRAKKRQEESLRLQEEYIQSLKSNSHADKGVPLSELLKDKGGKRGKLKRQPSSHPSQMGVFGVYCPSPINRMTARGLGR